MNYTISIQRGGRTVRQVLNLNTKKIQYSCPISKDPFEDEENPDVEEIDLEHLICQQLTR